MGQLVTAGLVAIAAWWLATGAMIIAARVGRGHRMPGLILATLFAGAALFAIFLSGSMNTVTGVYLGFFGALGVWAWHELTFLTGLLTGPQRTPCPAGLSGWARFRAGFLTVRSHELAIVLSAGIIALVLLGAENKTALWVFLLLWAMRVAAKLNIFLGAPNAVSDLLPHHLSYLTSYFRTDRISPLFWTTVTAAVCVCIVLLNGITTAADVDAVARILIVTFLALAVLEHLFLILPVRDSALWAWALANDGVPVQTNDKTGRIEGPDAGGRPWT